MIVEIDTILFTCFYFQVLHRDIRHLITYVKEAHGGVFRIVALSGLLDSADRPNKSDNNLQTTRVIRLFSINNI